MTVLEPLMTAIRALVTISDRHGPCVFLRGRCRDGQAEEGPGAAAADLADTG